MVAFNLLPWREMRFVYQQKSRNTIFALSVVLALSMIVGLHCWFTNEMHLMHKHVLALREEVLRLTNKQQKQVKQSAAELLSPQLQQLVVNHRSALTVLNELSRRLDASVCFTDMVREKEKVVFVGVAHSAAEFTEFLRYWRGAYLFSEIKIEQLQQSLTNSLMQFRFAGVLRGAA